jgi:hypothetical protein
MSYTRRTVASVGVAGWSAVALASALAAVPVQDAPVRGGRGRVATAVRCAADLGAGAKSGRRFCDVIVGRTGAESIAMAVPARRGTATLRFDLHTRFVVADARRPPAEAFERHSALVAVLAGTGDEIVRAAVTREFRTIEDLFDRISGGGRDGGFKAVAPGGAEPVVAVIAEGVTAIGIVGVSVERQTIDGRAVHDTPGRPVAIASNFRLEYTPR